MKLSVDVSPLSPATVFKPLWSDAEIGAADRVRVTRPELPLPEDKVEKPILTPYSIGCIFG